MALPQFPIIDISHLIPQKTPFVMVDTLLDFSENNVTSSFKIKEDNLFLKDNILLESGLIENMAQTVALHTGFDFFLKKEVAPTGYIGSIKKVDILKLPSLNDIITTQVSILHEFNGVTMVAVKVFNSENEEIATSEMKTVIAN
jgi:predicted hotdog family 3-hydroxylacyl-ACP dehydratase